MMTTKNLVTVSEGTSWNRPEEYFLQENKIEKITVVERIIKLVGLITFRDNYKTDPKPIAKQRSIR